MYKQYRQRLAELIPAFSLKFNYVRRVSLFSIFFSRFSMSLKPSMLNASPCENDSSSATAARGRSQHLPFRLKPSGSGLRHLAYAEKVAQG